MSVRPYIRMWYSYEQGEWIVKMYLGEARFRAAFRCMDSAQEALAHCQMLAATVGQ